MAIKSQGFLHLSFVGSGADRNPSASKDVKYFKSIIYTHIHSNTLAKSPVVVYNLKVINLQQIAVPTQIVPWSIFVYKKCLNWSVNLNLYISLQKSALQVKQVDKLPWSRIYCVLTFSNHYLRSKQNSLEIPRNS